MGLFSRRECGEFQTTFAGVLQLKCKIGRRLKRFRTEKGLTQKSLAATVCGGLDYTYIGKIERGEQLPSLKILIKISEALSVPVSSFFPDETVSAVCEVSASEMNYHAGNERWCELLATLKLLHEDDIPLLIEIAKVLARHRTTRVG
jgi:transcriptional regulator with XRE-family HTH domain